MNFEIQPYQQIYFGDLHELSRQKNGDYRLHSTLKKMYLGNYTVTFVQSEKKLNSMIIIHQENINPFLVAEILIQNKDQELDSPPTKRARLFGKIEYCSRDWFPMRRISPEFISNFDLNDYRDHIAHCMGNVHFGNRCRKCKKVASQPKIFTKFVDVENWQMEFFHKIYKGKLLLIYSIIYDAAATVL